MRLFPRSGKDRGIEGAVKYIEDAMKGDWETMKNKTKIYIIKSIRVRGAFSKSIIKSGGVMWKK